MQSLDSLIIFINVVEQKSFSAAADFMGTSKANVSRQIAKLEGRLGIQLFQRSTRSIKLTEAGVMLYQSSKDSVYNLDEAICDVMKMQAVPRGLLRISTAGLFGETRVAAAAARYMQQYKGVNIELNFTDRYVDIINEGYDLAIRSGILEDSTLIAKRISSRRLILCASPEYLQRHGSLGCINDLKKHFCLKGASPVWHLSDKDGKSIQYKIDASWTSNNAHATLQACLNGLGIAQLPEYYIKEKLAQQQLLPLLEKYEPADNGIWAVYSNRNYVPAKVKKFIDLLIH